MQGWCTSTQPCHPSVKPWKSMRPPRRATVRAPPLRAGYQDLRTSTEIAYHRARELLPALERAQHQLCEAQGPAEGAARRLEECQERTRQVSHAGARMAAELEAALETGAGGQEAVTFALMEQHARCMLQSMRPEGADDCGWTLLPQQQLRHDGSLPHGAALMAQTACFRDPTTGERYSATAVVAATRFMRPLQETAWELRLHWAAAGWQPPPPGWRTLPTGSSPAPASNALDTPMARHHPVLPTGAVCRLTTLHSCVVCLPVPGPDSQADMQFVLRQGHAWVKAEHHRDFWIDLSPTQGWAEWDAWRLAGGKNGGRGARGYATTNGNNNGNTNGTATAAPVWDRLGSWDWADDTAQAAVDNSENGSTANEASPKVQTPAEPQRAPSSIGGPAWVQQCLSWAEAPLTPKEGTDASEPGALHARADDLLALAEAVLPELAPRHRELCHSRWMLEEAAREESAAQADSERAQQALDAAGQETSSLGTEVAKAMEAARKGVASLRGRLTEVTQSDLEALAGQVALGPQGRPGGGGLWKRLPWLLRGGALSSPRAPVASPSGTGEADCTLTFVQQVSGQLAGLDAAVLVQVFRGARSIVLGVAVAEAFPSGGLGPALQMHWGLVAHQHGVWSDPPAGWSCDAAIDRGATDVLLTQYNMVAEDGSPVFVDPVLNAAALRLPRDGLRGFAGVEFLLRSADGRWLPVVDPGVGGRANLFVPLPTE